MNYLARRISLMFVLLGTIFATAIVPTYAEQKDSILLGRFFCQ